MNGKYCPNCGKPLGFRREYDIQVGYDDIFYFVEINGKIHYRTEDSYKAYMFVAELKIKLGMEI